jgi:hypothetical protein
MAIASGNGLEEVCEVDIFFLASQRHIEHNLSFAGDVLGKCL